MSRWEEIKRGTERKILLLVILNKMRACLKKTRESKRVKAMTIAWYTIERVRVSSSMSSLDAFTRPGQVLSSSCCKNKGLQK